MFTHRRPFVYFGVSVRSPESSGIVVPKDSPLQTLAELKGKKVAFTRGSSAHYLVALALKKVGLTFTDIKPVYLQPPDARAALFGWSIPAADGKSLVAVVSKVPAALPTFHIAQIHWAWVQKLLGSALAISFLGLLEALAVAKSIATYTRQPLDYNRQCLAEGISNLVGGFFQSLPGSGSLTRSSINYQSDAITRISGIYSGVIVAAVVLLFGPYARFIPKSALAGLLFITAARLIDWKRLGYAPPRLALRRGTRARDRLCGDLCQRR